MTIDPSLRWHVIHADCLDAMAAMAADSVDSIVNDPPYGLAFMGKAWDHGVPGVPFWAEALRVAKPGAHLVAFGGTRTYHRLACAIEDAGWEIRDCLSWLYGSGFPKSHNLDGDWQGWGTALKPAWEPIILARKPLVGTVAANVAAHGTGALNVDGCRIGTTEYTQAEWTQKGASRPTGTTYGKHGPSDTPLPSGRWPANVVLDEDAAAMLDAQSGDRPSTGTPTREAKRAKSASIPSRGVTGWADGQPQGPLYSDSGGASRFFYCAKASRREREAGLEGMPERVNLDLTSGDRNRENERAGTNRNGPLRAANHHPTVKPIALMRWLVRLVTPPGGLVLDPFTGSGTTGCAAVLEGFRFIGCEREAEYVAIAEKRIAYWAAQRETPEPDLFAESA